MGLLVSLVNLISTAMTIYTFAIIIYVFMSWFPGARESTFGIFLGRIVEPYMEVFRRIIPSLGMIDISPIVALIVLQMAQAGLSSLVQMLYTVI